MALHYHLDSVDETGARFALDEAEAAFGKYFAFGAAALLTVFAGMVLADDTADRLWGVGLLIVALIAVAVGVRLHRQPAPPVVLRFDNRVSTLFAEDARGRASWSVPYTDVLGFEGGRATGSGADGRGQTYYTISATLRDGRRLSLGGNTSEPTRDAQLADLRRFVTLPATRPA